MADQEETAAGNENSIPKPDSPKPKASRKRTPAQAQAVDTPAVNTSQPPSMRNKQIAALSVIAAVLALMVLQIVLTAISMSANLQTRDILKQTHQLQVCEANINLTAQSQTDANQKLKTCLSQS